MLPMLSTVVPIGTHGELLKVRYNGQLIGYMATDALEKRTRNLPAVIDTEKWVVTPGPSLQSFLGNAVTTQGSGGFIPGESITVSDNQVTATCTGDEGAWFETWGTTRVPTAAPGGAFGIQFRITFTSDPLFSQPWLALIGSRGQWIGNWWTDFREIGIAADRRIVSNATTNSSKVVSTFPLLRSGQLYDIRFPDGTGRRAMITLPDGTLVDDIDMTSFPWNDKGGCFPDHTLVIGMLITARSSTTISDLAFVVPPTVP
jgi:hypothetical protein